MKFYKLPKKIEYEIVREDEVKNWILKNWDWNVGDKFDIGSIRRDIVRLVSNELNCYDSYDSNEFTSSSSKKETNRSFSVEEEALTKFFKQWNELFDSLGKF